MRGFLVVIIATGFIGPRAQAAVITYYRFEDGIAGQAASTLLDSSGNSANGSTVGGPIYSANAPAAQLVGVPSNGGSLSFDRDDDVAVFNNPFIFNSGFGNATLEFWLNPNDQTRGAIFWTRGDDLDENRFHIYMDETGTLGFDYRDPLDVRHALLEADGSVSVPLDMWSHIAIVRQVDSATEDTYRIFLNGQLEYTAIDVNPNLPTATPWTIGGRGSDFGGYIDEVRMSDTALSPAEFLYVQPVPDPSTLVAWVTAIAISCAISGRRLLSRRLK